MTSRRALVVDRWDRERYDTLDFPTFAAEGEALRRLAPDTGPELWADLFALFDLVVPALVDADSMAAGFGINHRVIATMSTMPETALLRSWTQGDAFASASASMSLRPTVEVIYDRLRTTEKVAEALATERRRLEDMDEEEAAPDLADLVEREAAAEALAGRDTGMMVLLLRSAARQVADATEAEVERARMWSGGHDLTRMPLEKRLELARRLRTAHFAAMADLFGAIRQLMAAAKRTVVPEAPDDLGDVEYGRDLARVLPSALAQLADPDQEWAFLAAYANGRLPMMEQRGTETIGRGGVICCTDTSVSMATPMAPKGTRDMRAKALGLVLLDQCRAQGRSFYGIVFSDRYDAFSGELSGQPQLMEFDFSGEFPPQQVIDYAEAFFGGGTNFTLPLDRALAILEAEFAATGKTESDIVFITDGEARVTPRWMERFHRRLHAIGGRVWGLTLATRRDEPLSSICEGRVASFDDITSPDANLLEVMAGVSR